MNGNGHSCEQRHQATAQTRIMRTATDKNMCYSSSVLCSLHNLAVSGLDGAALSKAERGYDKSIRKLQQSYSITYSRAEGYIGGRSLVCSVCACLLSVVACLVVFLFPLFCETDSNNVRHSTFQSSYLLARVDAPL